MRRLSLVPFLLGVGVVTGTMAVPAFAQTVKTEGSVRKGVYTSPDKSFQVKVPKLLQPGAVIYDDRLVDGGRVVYFKDDLCRQYFVHKTPTSTPVATIEDLRRLVDDQIAKTWQAVGQAEVESIAPIDIGRGPALAVTLKKPSGPCAVFNGSGSPAPVPATLLLDVFVQDGAIYEVGYTVGERDMGMFSFLLPEASKPQDELLKAFLAGVSIATGVR